MAVGYIGDGAFAIAFVPILTWNRYNAEELLDTDQFGKIVDSYEGEGYMVLLTTTPSGKKARLLCFEEVIFGNYAKEPVFTGQYTEKSYQTLYLELESRRKTGRDPGVFIEYDREDGCFIEIHDFEADPYFRMPGRLYIQRVRVFDEDWEIIEEQSECKSQLKLLY